jgi:hypothetical protein
MMTKGMYAQERDLLNSLRELKRVEKEMSAVNLTTCPIPDNERKPDDILLGTASPELRRLWVVSEITYIEFMHVNDLIMKGELVDEMGRSLKLIKSECVERLKHLHNITEYSINEEFLSPPPSTLKFSSVYVAIVTRGWEICMRPHADGMLDIASEYLAGVLNTK